MKFSILLFLLTLSCFFAVGQGVTELSPGKYETINKASRKGWEKGDLILLDNNRYKLSSGSEAGEYRFSVAAQRIFFTSGPLMSAFTRVTLVNNKPVIIIPAEENGSLGITTEVWASKQ